MSEWAGPAGKVEGRGGALSWGAAGAAGPRPTPCIPEGPGWRCSGGGSIDCLKLCCCCFTARLWGELLSRAASQGRSKRARWGELEQVLIGLVCTELGSLHLAGTNCPPSRDDHVVSLSSPGEVERERPYALETPEAFLMLMKSWVSHPICWTRDLFHLHVLPLKGGYFFLTAPCKIRGHLDLFVYSLPKRISSQHFYKINPIYVFTTFWQRCLKCQAYTAVWKEAKTHWDLCPSKQAQDEVNLCN